MREGIDVGFDEFTLDNLVQGKLLREVRTRTKTEVYLGFRFSDYAKQAIQSLYKEKKKVTQEDVIRVLERHGQKRDVLIDNYFKNIGEDNFFRVETKKELKDGSVIVKFKKIDIKDKMKLITRISRRLAEKLPKNMIVDILKDSITESFDTEEDLKRLDKITKKKRPKFKKARGCFNILVDDIILRIR